jgi:hypothetical protein
MPLASAGEPGRRRHVRGCHHARLGLTFAPHRTMSESRPSSAEQNEPPKVSVPTDAPAEPEIEIGGRTSGLDPTRYGDWEKNGRCIDF